MRKKVVLERCPRCCKPKTKAAFSRTKNRKGEFVRSSYCRDCYREINQEWRRTGDNQAKVTAKARHRRQFLRARSHVEMPPSKFCPRCETMKPASEWGRDKSRVDGLPGVCKSCGVAAVLAYYARDEARARRGHLLQRYGISLADWDRMFEKQGGRCAICMRHEGDLLARKNLSRGFRAKLVVDHCHMTGKIRGLLCDECNNLLGRARDDVTVLSRAIAYLSQ